MASEPDDRGQLIACLLQRSPETTGPGTRVLLSEV